MASGDGESEGASPFDEEERRRELGELRPFKLQKLCAEQGLDESGGKQALIDRLIDQSATTGTGTRSRHLPCQTCPARPVPSARFVTRFSVVAQGSGRRRAVGWERLRPRL